MNRLEQLIARPLPRDVTLWMLNDRLDEHELRRQLRAFHAAGWARVITRTYNGLRTEYLSEEWMQRLEAIVDEAERLGLRLWFQAGYMPSAVPELPAEHALTKLVPLDGDDAGEEGDVPLDAGVPASGGAGGTGGQHGRLVIRRSRHIVDLVSPSAVRYYLAEAYDKTWMERFGRYFGGVIEAVWVDEPSLPRDGLVWGEGVLKAFAEQWGYDLAGRAWALLGDGPAAGEVRHDYWRTVTGLLRDAYFAEVSSWCADHGVMFTGHLMGEDTLASQTGRTGGAMPLYPPMSVPGIDHLTADLRWWHAKVAEDAPRFVMTPRQCASAANQVGRSDVLAEMYGVSSQGLRFADQKRIGEWFSLLGINIRCLHGSFYSLRGRRKRIYPPTLSPQQPWWPDGRMVSDYFARLNGALTEGTYAADVLVMHPLETGYEQYVPDDRSGFAAGGPMIRRLNAALASVSESLLAARRGFDYGDEQLLADEGGVQGRSLTVGAMRYPAVLLCGQGTLRGTTANLLERFVAGGGLLLRIEESDLPSLERIDGRADSRASDLAEQASPVADEPGALDAALEQASPRRVEVTDRQGGSARDVFLHERDLGGGQRLALLLNTSEDRPARLAVRIGGAAMARADLLSGRWSRPEAIGGDGTAAIDLAAGESALLATGIEVETDETRSAGGGERIELSGPWRIERRSPNALTLDFCRLRVGDGEYGPVIPVSAVQQILEEDLPEAPYRGPITLCHDVTVAEVPGRVALATEDPGEAEIRVNGAPIDPKVTGTFRDASFETVDISGALRPGENRIEIARTFAPLDKPPFGLAGLFANLAGSEIESSYLVGEFALRGRPTGRPDRDRCVRQAGPFELVAEPADTEGDLVTAGYPFLAGRVALSASAELGALSGRRAVLVLDAVECCGAHVRVNGRPVGTMCWSPWRLDITEAVRRGANEVTVELFNTLRNLLGPHHRPQGEPMSCWGFCAFAGRYDRESDTGYPLWYQPDKRRTETLAWTDDYFFLRFGLYGRARIELV